MELSDKELKTVLTALYRFRGDVSGASQAERNKLETVEALIGKIEAKVGAPSVERTAFDRQMEENLSVKEKAPKSGKKN
jgi:hypothetical protein